MEILDRIFERVNREGLTFEVRENGMFLTVKPNLFGEKDLPQLQSALDSQRIMNYDWPRISQAVLSGRESTVFSGEKWQVFEGKKEDFLSFNATPREVRMGFRLDFMDAGIDISLKDVEYMLKRRGIVHGVDWTHIADIFSKKDFNTIHVVAVCTEPEPGQDARIREIAAIDADGKPDILPDGRTDFRSIRKFPQVREGDRIVEKKHATPGKDGIDVFGRPLKAKMGADKMLPNGGNTYISEDGRHLVAGVDGYLYRSDGLIHVGEVLIVDGDVDFSVGNIKYRGDVIVCGNVHSGFKVDAVGNIRIEGDVDCADINSRKGSIHILKGLFGKNRVKLFADRDITVNVAQDAEIKCGGRFLAGHSLLNCTVHAGSITFGRTCLISGCRLNAFGLIEIFDIGNKNDCNYLYIHDRLENSLKEKEDKLRQLHEKVVQSMKPLENRIRAMAAMLKKLEGEPSPKVKEEIKTVQTQYQALRNKAEFIQVQMQNVQKESGKDAKDGIIRIFGKVLSDVILVMYGSLYDTSRGLRGMELYWTPGGISERPVTKQGDDA